MLCVRTLHFVMKRSYLSKLCHKVTPYSSSCSVRHNCLAVVTFYGRRRFSIAFEKAATGLYPEQILASPHRHIPFLQFQFPLILSFNISQVKFFTFFFTKMSYALLSLLFVVNNPHCILFYSNTLIMSGQDCTFFLKPQSWNLLQSVVASSH